MSIGHHWFYKTSELYGVTDVPSNAIAQVVSYFIHSNITLLIRQWKILVTSVDYAMQY